MLHAVSLKPLCVQGLKTPHRLRPCDLPLVGVQIAISMATEANGDVHMATAAVGTEDGGGRGGEEGYGGGEEGVSGCWRTRWLPGKFLRMPPTGESEVGLNLSISLSVTLSLLNGNSHSVKSPPDLLRSPSPLHPPHPIMHLLRVCVSSNLCLCLQSCGSCDHVWLLFERFRVWAGLTRMSLSSGIQEGFVRFCSFLTCRYVQSGDSQYDFLPVSVCNLEFSRVMITILFGELGIKAWTVYMTWYIYITNLCSLWYLWFNTDRISERDSPIPCKLIN